MAAININPKQLYEGCIQAALTHAIAVGMYPELNHEHSWDGINYCTNDSQSCRATITFHNEYIIAVFQSIDKVDKHIDALDFFDGAPKEIIEIAENEALQYVLDEDINGLAKPVVTAAFWGTWDQLNSVQSFDSIIENGGYLIRSQLLPYNDAMVKWRDYYNLDSKQISLIQKLFNAKIGSNEKLFILHEDEIELLYGDTDECLASLGELNIFKAK
ncbi:MAG: hypothetical protein IJX58_01380 [Clostridia bacterium]|nr:hypothetical protein [Clostridia bacterium]